VCVHVCVLENELGREERERVGRKEGRREGKEGRRGGDRKGRRKGKRGWEVRMEGGRE